MRVLTHKVEFDPVILPTVAYVFSDCQSVIGQLYLLATCAICKSTLNDNLIK